MAIQIPVGVKVRGPAEASPMRRLGSVRRTSTIDMRWPDGPGTQLRLTGRARDFLTPADGSAPVVLAEDEMSAGIAMDRTIEDVSSVPMRPTLIELIGARGGKNSRTRLANALPGEESAGTPLYLLLDDIAGASLIAGFAYSQWIKPELLLKAVASYPTRRMEGVCTGFQPGSGALKPDGSSMWNHKVQPVEPLPLIDDPVGWHELEDITDLSMRRARRIDVYLGDVIEIDSMFQDSSTKPEGGRVAVHEYRVEATADRVTGELLTLNADPRVLPYNECPLAAAGVQKLIGTPLSKLRSVVLEQLRGIDGCTHLNDAMRALAEVPVLVAPLYARRG